MSDFDDFDDFDFKPVTKGLGFHHGDKKDPKKFVKKINKEAKLPSSPSRLSQSMATSKVVAEREINKTDLSAFYTDKKLEVEEEVIPVVSIKKYDSTLYPRRICAWLLDVFILCVISTITFILCSFVSGIHINNILKFVSIVELSIFVASVFVIYYMIYFSILDMYKTPGKNMMKIQMSSELKNISLKMSFSRALLSLFFFTMMTDLHSKISKTFIVKSRK